MEILISDSEKILINSIANASKNLGVKSYIIGGYVRDKVMKRPSKDMDIVCIGDGIALAKELSKLLGVTREIVIFKRFGTAMVKHNEFELEFVGARKESYNFDSRKPVVESGSFQDDLNRRDFTINTLAIELKQDDDLRIVDTFGGLKHIEQKLIKTPLDPDITFSDDP